MSFGVFDTLHQYGILGLVVLALGYIVWILFNRTLKSEDDLKKKVDELEGEHREELTKTIKDSVKSSNSLKDTVLTLFGQDSRKNK
jgi:uncharacterized membrane-anchored protein YhcB (DUF1043 family)